MKRAHIQMSVYHYVEPSRLV